MSIVTFIKSLFNAETKIPETIKLDELKNWIKDKEDFNKKEIIEIMEFFEEKISTLIIELKENINILKNIDLKETKAEERIKFIVKQNLDYYTAHLQRLIDSLKILEIQEPEIMIKKINDIFAEFSKKSEANFQKATFLIGNELQKTKDSIKTFFKAIKGCLEKNKEFIQAQKIILDIKNKLKEIKKLKEINTELGKEIKNQDDKINNLNEQIKKNKQKIEEIKKSKEYRKEIEKKQKIINEKQDLKKQYLELKEAINFKSLAKIFHTNQKEMNLIKEFQNNFQETFEKNNPEILTNLLSDAKLNTIKINQKIKNQTNLKQEIKDLETDFNQKGDANILIKESEIVKINQEINELDYDIKRKQRRIEKNNDDESEIINKIKSETGKLNLKIIEEN